MRRLLLSAPIIIAVILGWGYWHGRTHASINITLNDAAKQKVHVEVTFFDAAGHPLAQAHTVEPYNFISVIHPEAGDCSNAAASVLGSISSDSRGIRGFDGDTACDSRPGR